MKKPIYTLSFALLIVISAIFSLSNSTGVSGRSTTGCGGHGCHGMNSSSNTYSLFHFDKESIIAYEPNHKYHVKLIIGNEDYFYVPQAAIAFNFRFNKGKVDNISSYFADSISPLEYSSRVAFSSSKNGYGYIEFDWTAPPIGSGDIVLSIAEIVVDGQSDTAGDAWNTETMKISEGTSRFPKFTSIQATNITNSGALISANIYHPFEGAAFRVEYGTTTNYDTTVKTTPPGGFGLKINPVSVSLSRLLPNTLYHYRFKVSSGLDTAYYSPDYTFTTKDSTGSSTISNVMNGKIELYPNPSNNYCMLTDPVEIQSCMAIDIEGKSRSLPFENIKTNTFKINTSHLKEGVYYITYSDRKGQQFFTKNQLIVTH